MYLNRSGSQSPRENRRGGSQEQGQHFLIDRQDSFHHLSTLAHQQSSSSTGLGGSGSNLASLSENRAEGGGGGGVGLSSSPQQPSRILARPGSYNQFVEIGGESQSLLALSSGGYGSSSQLLSPTSQSQLAVSQVNTIRFQVIIWNIGKLDVVTGAVPMTFRVTLFWNDTSVPLIGLEDELNADNATLDSAASIHRVWVMHGRSKAYQQELARDSESTEVKHSIPVPPLSILNVSTFETIGSAEVDMLRESTRLMRWTCMYRATVIQENLKVDAFPHDSHDINLKLAILSHRSKGAQWDRRRWRLALATMDDTQSSTRIPHGLIVGTAHMPGFTYNKERGLDFQFSNLNDDFLSAGMSNSVRGSIRGGSNNSIPRRSTYDPNRDTYLKVSLNVLRQSGYYDNNIVPLLALLNVVAVSVLTLKDTEFFQRGLLTLNIAFVAMSIRMTTDAHLPGVDYEIRLQHVLNEYFVVLMMLVMESMSVYSLRTYFDVSPNATAVLDWTAGILATAHNAYTIIIYYRSKRKAKERLHLGYQEKKGQ